MPGWSYDEATVAFYLVAYLGLNIGLNYYCNWVLKKPPVGLGFPAPLLFSWFHMLASTLGATLLMTLRPELGRVSSAQFCEHKLKLGSLSLLFCVSIGSNNLALPHIGLSVNQVLKATCTLFVLGFSFVIEGKRYSRLKTLLVLLLVAGAVLSVPFGTPNAEAIGLFLTALSVICVAAKTSLASSLLRGVDGLTPIVLVFYESAGSTIFMLVGLLTLGEPRKLMEYLQGDGRIDTTVAVVLGGALMAFTYNLVGFKFLALTSSVTHAICGNIKIVAVVVIPALFIDKIREPRSWVGFCVFMVAAIAYSYVSHREAAKPQANDKLVGVKDKEAGAAPTESTPLSKG